MFALGKHDLRHFAGFGMSKVLFFANFKGDLQDFRWVVPAAGDRLFQYDLPIDE
jgi:hypothetical protein